MSEQDVEVARKLLFSTDCYGWQQPRSVTDFIERAIPIITAALAKAREEGRGEDAARLDFLEKAGANVSFYRDPLMDGLKWTISWLDYRTHRVKGKTLREAIDAAMQYAGADAGEKEE